MGRLPATAVNAAARAIVACAVVMTCACGQGSEESSAVPTPQADTPTALVDTPTAGWSPSPSQGIVESEPPSLAPVAEQSLLDAAGRWCPTSPAEWAEPCVEIDFPTVVRDGLSTPEYIYPWSIDMATDPLTYVPEDYEGGPNRGECWSAAVDIYPAMSGAQLIYCPAGAIAGVDWIDDPWTAFAGEPSVDPAQIVDYRDQDRLYIGQDSTYYPSLRAD